MSDLARRLDELKQPIVGSDYSPTRRDRSDLDVHLTPSGAMHVTGITATELPGEAAWRKLAADNGLDVPDGWMVRLTRATHHEAIWHRGEQGEDAVTRPGWRLEFAIDPPGAVADRVDMDALFKEIKRARPKRIAQSVTDGALVISVNDWQLHKSDGDGIAGTVARVIEGFDGAVDRLRELRRLGRGVDEVVLAATGDIVEGCDIFPNQAYQLTGDLRDQVNAARRLIVAGIRTLAPHVGRVTVAAVGGNHGENRRQGGRVNRHDNLDVAVFEQVAEVIGANPDAYGHVSFTVPRDELAITVPVQGWILGLAHGHTAKLSGGTEAKLHAWYDRMAGDKQPIGDSDVLLTSHYHHGRTADWGGCQWVQARALDGGSPQHTDSFGGASAPGIDTFVMRPGDRYADPFVIRST